MPPIPVHLNDPIVPSKADGVTPQTSSEQQTPSTTTPATTTQAASAISSYPQARPGAVAGPVPTPYAAPPPPAPSRTIPAQSYNPPPPQPGAVPIPTYQHATSTLPPPPKAGEGVLRPHPPGVTSMPPQMHVPAPQQNYAPTHTTTTATGPPGPTTVNLGPVTSPVQLAHTGYQQDTHAQEMSAAQRASLEQEDRKYESEGLGGLTGTDGGVWGAVKGWAGAAGQKAAELEKRVWDGVGGAK